MKIKHRHQEDLKQIILQAAKKLFLQQGYPNTSMRKIATEVGISPTTIYLYYKDKAEVMHALHQEGFKLLTSQFQALRNVENAFERLKAMGSCYINFALENRDFYEIMFIMEEPLEHLEERNDCDLGWEEGEAAFQYLLNTIEACQEMGYFKNYDSKTFSLLVWSNMHGLCTLGNNGHLQLISDKMAEGVRAEDIIQMSFSMYVSILEKL